MRTFSVYSTENLAQVGCRKRIWGRMSVCISELIERKLADGRQVQRTAADFDLCSVLPLTPRTIRGSGLEGVEESNALEMLLKQFPVGPLGLSDELLLSSYPLKAPENGEAYQKGKKGAKK